MASTERFIELAAPGVQQLQPYLPGKPVEELERELGITGSIKLASNENPLGPSPAGLAAAQKVLGNVNYYPDGGGHLLRMALAEKHGVTPDCITLGNGSNDVLELIARAFLTADRAAMFSQYAFAVYPIVTQAIGATAQVVPALPVDHDNMPYGHDLDSMAGAIDEATRVVFIANPNNPTGTWLAPDELDSFLARVPGDIIVVLDEAYYEYMPEDLQPATHRLLECYDNLVVTRTFSKIYGLAGLRVGYGVSCPEIADLLNRVRQPFNVNLPAQAAAVAALADEAHLGRSIECNRTGLKQLSEGLRRLGLGHIPSIGNFITVDFNAPAMPIYQALLREGVIVRPVGNYGMPHHLRITVGTGEQNKRLLDALENVLQ